MRGGDEKRDKLCGTGGEGWTGWSMRGVSID